jgi:hypothetical protein
MTARTDWLDANQRHVGRALDEVRALLERRPVAAPADEEEPFALDVVTRVFGLTSFERKVLLLCAGVELDSKFASVCAEAQGDTAIPYPTFSLALGVFPDAHWSAIAPGGALRRWHLIEIADGGVVTRARLRIDERLLHFITGIDAFDERLAGIITPFDDDAPLVPSHDAIAARVAEWCRAGVTAMQICGGDEATRRLIAASAVRRFGASLAVAEGNALPASARDADFLARLWDRDAALSGAVLMVECEPVSGDAASSDTVRHFVDRLHAPVIIGARERRTVSSRRPRTIDVPAAPSAERRQVWQSALGDAAASLNGQIDALTMHFRLSPAAVSDAVDEVAGVEPQQLGDALWQACRARTRQRIEELARRVESRAGWDDLVLPPQQQAILRDIASAVQYRAVVYERWGFGRREWRGLGVSALFCGTSGTGKTLAAEVLANELKLDLYAIDLSGVVSKYIGETEKNLRRIFDAAEDGGAILLFDEADALFGKRSEVHDSHDRYANIEVSYLLQRMEAYRGIAILTTNMRNALDAAFLRRLRYVVQFPFPGMPEREEIWRRVFPAELPLQGVDASKLARLNIAGGNIRNIALSAAFLAARNDDGVRMSHLLDAARAEYVKLERTLNDSEVAGWL